MRLLIIRTEGWRPPPRAHQGQLVLITPTPVPGASSRPPVTAAASSHGDSASAPRPQRRTTAAAAATIAATASPAGEPPGAGSSGSGSSAHSTPVNADRRASARDANRRSQPRTVEAGRPACSATRRCPSPAAAPASAAPITAAVSARRASTLTGSNTCVHPHPAHLARRGRSQHRPAPASRTSRRRACPHPRSRPPHPGHPSRPDDSNSSTPAASLPTVSTAPPCASAALPAARPKDDREGRSPLQPAHAVAGHKKGQAGQACPPPLVINVARGPLHAHHE